MKRRCQFRAELELQNKYSKVPIDVDGIYQHCATASGATVYNRPGFLQLRERLHDTLLSAVNKKGVLPLKGLTKGLLSVVLSTKERAAWAMVLATYHHRMSALAIGGHNQPLKARLEPVPLVLVQPAAL